MLRAPVFGRQQRTGTGSFTGGDKANTMCLDAARRGSIAATDDGVGTAWRWKSLSNDIDLASMGLLRFTYQSTRMAIDGKFSEAPNRRRGA